MPTELAVMLLWPFKYAGIDLPPNKDGETVTLTHEVHAASKWVRESKENYNWALGHFATLLDEYETRYKRKHFAVTYFEFIIKNIQRITFTKNDLTPFARCFSGMYINTALDAVEAYRQYYFKDKVDFSKWPSLAKIPAWWPQEEKYVSKNFENGVYKLR